MTSPPKSPEDPKKFYGYLFKPDKGPTDILRELLAGIGRYIQKNIGEPEVRKLTPSKLAEFYKAVGGNYDPVFLEPPHDRISFIYTSLGCQHTLQPGENDYEPPKIPALTLKGFVRWQSIETLLGPEEHVPYLQYAVQHFEIMRYDGTTRFPQQLPKECLPSKGDDQVMKWHEDCSKRLWKEYITPMNTPKVSPRRRSYTGPPAGTPLDNANYKYGYAHVKVPDSVRYGGSAAGSPRMRPKEREDYFNSKPVPAARRSRPTTAESFRTKEAGGQRRSSPEEYEDIFDRGRRRSVPKNYYNSHPSGMDGSDLSTPGRATSHPASPRESRPHADSFGASAKEHYVRRHSHPRHAHPHVTSDSGSSNEEGETEEVPGPPSPQYSKMRGAKSNIEMGGSAARLSRESQRASSSKIPDLRYEAASPINTPSAMKEGRRYSPQVLSGFGNLASGYGNAHARAYSGLDVPTMGGAKARIYKVHSADEKGELRHKHSTSTSGGSRSNSREDRDSRESKRSGGVRWVKELVGDALPFAHGSRRHSDSPPLRDREEIQREERANEKYRREDVGSGRKDRSSDEERRRRKREEAVWREREREGGSGRRQPEVRPRY